MWIAPSSQWRPRKRQPGSSVPPGTETHATKCTLHVWPCLPRSAWDEVCPSPCAVMPSQGLQLPLPWAPSCFGGGGEGAGAALKALRLHLMARGYPMSLSPGQGGAQGTPGIAGAGSPRSPQGPAAGQLQPHLAATSASSTTSLFSLRESLVAGSAGDEGEDDGQCSERSEASFFSAHSSHPSQSHSQSQAHQHSHHHHHHHYSRHQTQPDPTSAATGSSTTTPSHSRPHHHHQHPHSHHHPHAHRTHQQHHPAVEAFRRGTLSFAFSGGGFWFPYSLGCVQMLSEMGIITPRTPLVGASCGAVGDMASWAGWVIMLHWVRGSTGNLPCHQCS